MKLMAGLLTWLTSIGWIRGYVLCQLSRTTLFSSAALITAFVWGIIKIRASKVSASERKIPKTMRFTRWWVPALLVSAFLCSVVLSDQTISAHTGSNFGRSSRDPKFKIEFHSEDSPFAPDEDQESIIMPNKHGEKFLCYLPKVEKSKSGKPVAQQNLSSMVMESETHMKLKTPDELLEVLKDRCFIRQEGWWSYEFCYQRGLRQIHLEDEKLVQEFFLGVYDAEATEAHNQNLSDVSILKDPRSKDASQRYHAHIFNNGTLCDLTKQPRETEVRFVCSEPRAMINSITELSTCKYALTFQCPTLCKHPLFNEERPVSHTIHCNALQKEERKTQTADVSSRDGKITMVTDVEYSPVSTPEEYAT